MTLTYGLQHENDHWCIMVILTACQECILTNLVFQSIQSFANKLKQSLKVIRAWCSNKNIWEPEERKRSIELPSTLNKNAGELISLNSYPAATAPAMARPRAADFPRPRAAVKATVLRKSLSTIALKKATTAFPCKVYNIL